MTNDPLPLSVVIPTLARVEPLRACLRSLAACEPPPAEVLLSVQGDAASAEELAAEFPALPIRVVADGGRGVSRARNVGLRAAAHEGVLVTDDDCTVAPDWVARGAAALDTPPRAIVTGRVVPDGDPRSVPSTKDDEQAADFTGAVHAGALFPNNMALHRDDVLAAGGFDERFGPDEAAEDNEFCYRWLRGGGGLRYDPSLVVYHHDWRSPEELERLYVRYAIGQGFFYAKHLRRRDPTMLRFIARDLYWALRGAVARRLRRHEWVDPRLGLLRGLPVGLRRGWREYAHEEQGDGR